jgi:HSP20 family protein
MQLVRFDPFRGLLDDNFSGMQSLQKGLKVYETDKAIIAEAVVAGVPKKNVDIEIEDGVLTIKAEVKEETEAKNEYKSTSYQYYYTTALSGGQWEKAEADVVDGIVKVTIPKAESARPRKISVKSK